MSHRNKLMYHDTIFTGLSEILIQIVKLQATLLRGKFTWRRRKFAENSICNLNVQQRARSRMKYLARKKTLFSLRQKKRI